MGMLCDSAEIAKRRFDIINRKTQLVMQWPDLPLEIKDTDVEDQCCFLVERTLYFFNNQRLEMDGLLEEIEKLRRDKGF